VEYANTLPWHTSIVQNRVLSTGPALISIVETQVGGRSERRILKALHEGRREAYEEVIEAHYASIYRLLLFLTRDASLAEDMTQEVFASAWAAIQGFRGDASVKTWLRRIAYNLFVDAQRRRKRDESLAGKLGEGDPGMAADPLSRIMTDEHLVRMYRAMDDLDGQERAVVLLHYLDGLSYREMAQVLRQPAGTLKWVTHQALEKLRTQVVGKAEP
jgi:RNA polymerase sigma-70 factor, ECF subfamily